MKFTTTLLLALLLLALAGFVYLYEIKGGAERQKSEEVARKFLALNADSVTAIALQPAGITFQKESGKWQIVQPIDYPASEEAVQALLDRLAAAKRERDITTDANTFATYGLAPAHRQIVIGRESIRDTVYLGDKNTTNSYVYARLNSKPEVVLTEIALWNNSEKKLEDWRDRGLLKFEPEQVQRITLTVPSSRFELHKQADTWRLVHPFAAEADDNKISQILSRMSYSTVTQFVAENLVDPEQYGLDKPNYELRITLNENGSQKIVRFGKKTNEGFYAHDPARPQVFLVDASLVRDLDLSLMDLRNKKLADFESYRADYVMLQYPDTSIVCEKDSSGQWLVTSSQNKKAKSWKVSNITSTLAGLQAVTFVDGTTSNLAHNGLDNPRAKIIVKEKGAELAHVLLGKAEGENVYAKAANKATVVLVKKDEANRLLVQLSELIE